MLSTSQPNKDQGKFLYVICFFMLCLNNLKEIKLIGYISIRVTNSISENETYFKIERDTAQSEILRQIKQLKGNYF